MLPTARAALVRVALMTMLCIAVLTVTTQAAEAKTPRATASACSNSLCTKDKKAVRSCWRFRDQDRIARCFIERAARHYGQPLSQAYYVAHRESRYNWRVTNRSSGAAGLFQFMPRTWRFTPYRKYSPYHPRWAALAAMWMWKHGYASHWSVR